MTDLDSLKLYYYNTGTSTWVQVTSLSQFPHISKRMDQYGICQVALTDFEGALFSTWNVRDNTQMKVVDSDSHVLFQGYLKNRNHSGSGITLTIYGFASRLDEEPFYSNFIYAEGLVKDVPYTTLEINAAASNSISDTTYPYGICKVGSYFYVCSYSDKKVYKYTDAFVLVTSYDVSAKTSKPLGITHDGTFFYISTVDEDNILKYDNSFNWQSTTDISADIDPYGCYGLEYHDSQFYVIGRSGGTSVVFIFSNAWVLQDTISLDVAYVYDIAYHSHSNRFYVVTPYSYLYVYDSSFERITGYYLSADSWGGACSDGYHLFLVRSWTYTLVNVYFPNGMAYGDDHYIELKQDDEDNDYPDFAWDDDMFVHGVNGLMIEDATSGDSSETWDISAISATNETRTTGSISDTQTAKDGNYYGIQDRGDPMSAYGECTVDGDSIDSTVYNLRSLTLNYRFGIKVYATINWCGATVRLYLKKDSDWVEIGKIYKYNSSAFASKYAWVEGSLILTEDLDDYLHKTGDDYDELNGLKFTIEGTANAEGAAILIDHVEVEIAFNAASISPIMEPIIMNGASWVATSLDFSSIAIQDEDRFRIGASTYEIIDTIQTQSKTEIYIKSTLSKYMARFFKGSNCMSALNDTCQLEGLHWAEDHQNGRIVLAKETDFVDSTLDLTTGNGDEDFDYDDKANHYRGVWVFGNASLNIQARTEDMDSTSFKWKQIVDDDIMTVADAQEVADAVFLELKDKRPSIIFTKTDTTNAYYVAEAMKTIDLTITKPTVAQATLPIRRLDIKRVGEHLKYTFYAGLGSTPPEEEDINLKRQISYMMQKLHQFRLTNSPLGAGATITPLDIAGIDTYIISIIGEVAIPVGAIFPYSGTSAPSGWLLCDGSAVSRTTYSTLFSLLGITHGQGDGSTTFNVPDLEGRFLRGVDNGAGRDPDAASRTAMNTGGNTGDNVGSIQSDELGEHRHLHQASTKYFASGSNANGPGTDLAGYYTAYAGGNETRPINAYVNFIIKY